MPSPIVSTPSADYLGQRGAEVEGLFGNSLGCAVENDGLELALSGVGVLLRALESAYADVFDVLAYRDLFEIVAVHRRIVADYLNGVGDNKLLERAAALERLVLETDDLCAVYFGGYGDDGIVSGVVGDTGGVVRIQCIDKASVLYGFGFDFLVEYVLNLDERGVVYRDVEGESREYCFAEIGRSLRKRGRRRASKQR